MGLTINIKALFTAQGLLKVLQIAIAFTCIGLLRNHNLQFSSASVFSSGDSDRQLTGVIAIGSSLLTSIPLLAGYVFFDHSNHLLEALFCFTAAVMNATGGGLAIEVYHELDHGKESVQTGLAMGGLMIINAIIYLVDAFTGNIITSK